ncbi:MAG: IS200/IS605 family transposase [Chloroflexota bacterium]
MPFSKCYFHAVWSTHRREAVITPRLETVIFEAIRAKSVEMECDILAMNGVEDHVHVAARLPPKIAPAEWLRNIKGLSARQVNDSFPDLASRFRWQDSYGLLTFGAKNLPFVTRYIENQKIHHAASTIEPYMEQTDDR